MWKPRIIPKSRVWRVVIIALVFVVLAARIAMPHFVLWYVNKTLSEVPGYVGRVDDIDIHLWRGAYEIQGVKIEKISGDVPVPLFEADRVDLSIYWRQLFRGALVGDIVMFHPRVNLVDGGTPERSQTGATERWTDVVKKLFPTRIDRLEVINGEAHFHNFISNPPVDLYLSKAHALATNLTNSEKISDSLAATVDADALAMDHADLTLHLKIDPYAQKPTFRVATKLLHLNVTSLNDLTRAYASFDFERGTFDLVIELAAKEGHIQGYAKPLFHDLKILSIKNDVVKDKDDLLQVFWEALVGITAEVFKNQPKDQLATVIPIDGDIEAPQVDALALIGGVLKNAFVRAFLPRFEHVAEPKASKSHQKHGA